MDEFSTDQESCHERQHSFVISAVERTFQASGEAYDFIWNNWKQFYGPLNSNTTYRLTSAKHPNKFNRCTWSELI